jgi:hypothetical protein
MNVLTSPENGQKASGGRALQQMKAMGYHLKEFGH